MSGWVPVTFDSPRPGVVVEVQNNGGALLKRHREGGSLWFLPDGSMYVYYTPTYWRPVS